MAPDPMISGVELTHGSDAPSDAGREEVPLPASRPATNAVQIGHNLRVRNGEHYEHGTVARYTHMRCRCSRCTAAVADYARQRRMRTDESPAEPAPQPTNAYPCPWGCGESFRSRQTRGAHVASCHPYTRIKPSYQPPTDTWVELPGDRWS